MYVQLYAASTPNSSGRNNGNERTTKKSKQLEKEMDTKKVDDNRVVDDDNDDDGVEKDEVEHTELNLEQQNKQDNQEQQPPSQGSALSICFSFAKVVLFLAPRDNFMRKTPFHFEKYL